MNASQRALAAASAWKDAEAAGKVGTKGGDRRGSSAKNSHLIERPRDYFSNLFGSNNRYIEQAKAVLDASPKIAEAVKAGATETWMKYPS